ncbi:hypothetical protein LVD15_20660 [Fulvivirga maritima]|uniref:type III-A CRISPR-associated protein Cas10/Csm1 n=1 Tax=Fulvivirga maritima TaxID=2904247 RepID=UPI001F36609D|nr:hypothetical protein [Fulvivirga maritima]UII25694.1 hypothetical protein LVD15_20660 [Fulvivirga maritima]
METQIDATVEKDSFYKKKALFEKALYKGEITNGGYVVKGDLSGIQSFIFNIPSKHASMYLKGRSAYLQLLSEVVARYVHDKLVGESMDFSQAVIYKGGGNFLLYYEDELIYEKIESLQAEIDKVLYEAHHEGLYLALAGVRYEKGYQATLNQRLQILKKRKFSGLSHHNLFEPYEKAERRPISGEKRIDNCGQEEVAGFYESFKKLAEEYIKAEAISFKSVKGGAGNYNSWDGVFDAFEQQVEFDNAHAEPYRMVNRIDVRSFDDLAKNSEGAEKLALLKVDVDNMGDLFSDKSLKQTQEISDALGFFFEEYLNTIIDEFKGDVELYNEEGKKVDIKENVRRIYTVYSGGDDAFLVGPWNVMVELASRLHQEFDAFAPKSAEISLSASLTIIDKNYPVIQAAETAENWLHLAKHRDGKNAICLFGEVFSWGEWGYIDKLVELLHGIIESTPGNPRAIIRKVEGTTSAFRKITNNINRHDELKMQSVYKLMYYVRHLKSGKNELAEIYKNIILDGFLRPDSFASENAHGLTKQVNVNYMIVPVACRLAEFYQRKMGKHDL